MITKGENRKTILQPHIGPLLMGLLLTGNALALAHLAFQGFSPSDFGSFLDAGYRVYLGQKPYTDFYYHTGPVHLYALAFFFLIAGFNKQAILLHLIVVSSISMTAVYAAGVRRIPRALALGCAALTGIGFFWGYPHPWYDMTAHLWGVLAAAAFMLFLPFENDRTAFRAGCFAGIMATLALFTKSNLGGTYGLAFFAVILFSPRRWPAFKGYLLGVAAVFLVTFIFMCRPLEYYQSVIQGYGAGRSSRFMRMMLIPSWLKNGYWIPLVTIHFALRRFPDTAREIKALFYGMSLVALLGLNVGSLQGPEHIPLLGICLALGFTLLYIVRPLDTTRIQRTVNFAAVLILLITGLFYAQRTVRLSFNQIDDPSRAEWSAEYPLTQGPFKGWYFPAPEGRALDGLAAFSSGNIAKDDSFLVFCDLHIAYGLLGLESFKGIVWQWPILPNPQPVFSMDGKIGKSIMDNPPKWILARFLADIKQPHYMRDSRYLLNFLGMPDNFFENYVPVQGWGEYLLLKRK